MHGVIVMMKSVSESDQLDLPKTAHTVEYLHMVVPATSSNPLLDETVRVLSPLFLYI